MVVADSRLLNMCGSLSSRLVVMAAAMGALTGGRLRGRSWRHTHGLAHRCQDRPAREQHNQHDSRYPTHTTHPFSISRHQQLANAPGNPPGRFRTPHKSARLKRKALPITETELNVIAALAIIGLSSRPTKG
jgi:hypothetical protein